MIKRIIDAIDNHSPYCGVRTRQPQVRQTLMPPTLRSVYSQFRAHRLAIAQLRRLESPGLPRNNRVPIDQLSDARHIVELTGRLLAEGIRSHGRGQPPSLVIDGQLIGLSNDGLSVVVKPLRRSRRPSATQAVGRDSSLPSAGATYRTIPASAMPP
jgi:hypothetical protein